MTTLIANQIERLNKAKADIKASIIAKGGIVPDTALIGDYADIIRGFEDMFNVGNYNYRVAPVDVAGLKEINWNIDDINYLKYNTLIPKGKDVGDTYKVSDANKRIKITSINDISTYKDDINFKYCPKFDTSKETDMTRMFYQCNSLTSVPLFDTSNVEGMYGVFYQCTSLTSVPLFDTSKVTNMGSMFSGCSSLTSIPQLDTSKVTNMSSMFQNCNSLTSVPLFDTSNVTDMPFMFSGCSSLASVPLFDTSKVTNMFFMFQNCNSLTTLGGFLNLKTNLGISNSPNLTHDSLMNVINKAADVTSSSKTLTLGTTNLSKLTSTEKAIATNKGWVLK